MDSFVMAVGAVVLVGMIFMMFQAAGVIHQAPRPEEDLKDKQDLPRSDDDKPGLAG